MVGQHLNRAEHSIEIVHGFAHAHEDEIRDLGLKFVCGMMPLGDDFCCGEVPHASHRGRLAERASHGAAHLARKAQSLPHSTRASFNGHDDRLGLAAIEVAKQEFSGAVFVGHAGHDPPGSDHGRMLATAVELPVGLGGFILIHRGVREPTLEGSCQKCVRLMHLLRIAAKALYTAHFCVKGAALCLIGPYLLLELLVRSATD